MEIFYGGAIQGNSDREAASHRHRYILELIKRYGHDPVSEHTTSRTKQEAGEMLEAVFGPLPPDGIERRQYVRDKMIEVIDGDIDAAIFEVSVPSLGTGIEIAHAYLRPERGLSEIPILLLYERDFWPERLSTMIQGIPPEKYPNVTIAEYGSHKELQSGVEHFLTSFSDE